MMAFSSHGEKVNFFLYCFLVLLLLAVFSILMAYDYIINNIFSFDFKPSELNESNKGVLSGIFRRISLTLPFVWLASHVNGVINRRKKLHVEYEHKRIIMEFYVAFRNEIKGDDKMREAFAKAITDVVLRFPSVIGERQESDSPMDKILNTIKGKDKNLEKNVENVAKGKKDAT